MCCSKVNFDVTFLLYLMLHILAETESPCAGVVATEPQEAEKQTSFFCFSATQGMFIVWQIEFVKCY